MSKPTSQTDAMSPADELVAYLDGELDSVSSARVERRLAEDEAYRQQLKELQQSWDMLDMLDRAEPDESFTRDTVEMVAVKAAEDLSRKKTQLTGRRYLLLGGSTLGIGLSLLLGYWLIASAVSRPNQKLVRDLPVIERIDEYQSAESLEFLKMLEREGLFGKEFEDAL